MLRGFQVHDFRYVVTGYDPSGVGEVALQAFCLAQTRFPYFGMWMSVVTAQMTYLDPHMISPIMDAIADGWRHGRSARLLAFEPWEDMLEEPLHKVRERYAVDTSARRGTVYAPTTSMRHRGPVAIASRTSRVSSGASSASASAT